MGRLHTIGLIAQDVRKYYPQIVFVLLQKEKEKGPIKRYFDSKGVVSQFMLQRNM
jgi:hypothetical protein